VDLGGIEAYLQRALDGALPAGVTVRSGPAFAGHATGLKPEVFIHAARFEDWNGTMPDGARIGRRRAGVKGAGGFVEERPGRIAIEVTCLAGTLKHVQLVSTLLSPLVLLALERMPDPVLAKAKGVPATLTFREFTVALHHCGTSRETDGTMAIYRGQIAFHLDGFLHVSMKKNPQ
jgi:hypothetical protein